MKQPKLPADLARLCGGQLTHDQAIRTADRLVEIAVRLTAFARAGKASRPVVATAKS